MVDEINEETPPDLTNNRVGSLSGVIDQLKRTETNTSTRERKQLAAIKQSNEILSFLYDATEAQIEVNQEAVDAQRLADLQEKERLQEEAHNRVEQAVVAAQESHDLMVELSEEVDRLRDQANSAHAGLTKSKKEADSVHSLYIVSLRCIHSIQDIIKAMEARTGGGESEEKTEVSDLMSKLMSGDTLSTEELMSLQRN